MNLSSGKIRRIISVLSLVLFSVLLTCCEPPRFLIRFQDGSFPVSGYAGTGDTFISSISNNTYYGDQNYINLGSTPTLEYRMLVKFDIAHYLPPAAEVKSAYLTLSSITGVSGTDIAVSIHPVTQDWIVSLAPVWLNMNSSFSAAVADTVIANPEDDVIQIELPAGLVQSWLGNASGNHGIMLMLNPSSQNKTARFSSSENAEPSYRPMLSVYYNM